MGRISLKLVARVWATWTDVSIDTGNLNSAFFFFFYFVLTRDLVLYRLFYIFTSYLMSIPLSFLFLVSLLTYEPQVWDNQILLHILLFKYDFSLVLSHFPLWECSYIPLLTLPNSTIWYQYYLITVKPVAIPCLTLLFGSYNDCGKVKLSRPTKLNPSLLVIMPQPGQ